MDERSFDNLVRELVASAQSRRALALATVGLAFSLAAPLAQDTDAARRRQARRKKKRNAGKGKQGGSGKGQQSGHQGDCGQSGSCTADPQTGDPGFTCPDGSCSCGGTCCDKGFACFVERSTPGREVCCNEDTDQIPPTAKDDLVVCPGEKSDANLCCEWNHCFEDGTCPNLLFGRYRRNPR